MMRNESACGLVPADGDLLRNSDQSIIDAHQHELAGIGPSRFALQPTLAPRREFPVHAIHGIEQP